MNDPTTSNLVETWQSRAKECRSAAKRLRSADARRRMIAAAEQFERMAVDGTPSLAPSDKNDPWRGVTL
jgi:hypothetical protein